MGSKSNNQLDSMTKNPSIKEECNVYIIGREKLSNELLLHFLAQATSPSFNCKLLDASAKLETENTNEIKKLVLFNCHGVHEQNIMAACQRQLPDPSTDFYFACVNVPHDSQIAENAISDGVHGIFYENDSLNTLMRGIKAILKGELWFSRDTLSATLSNLVEKKKTFKSSHHEVSNRIRLTKREKEILKFIALGKTNEEIAKKLNISILTVKTHVRNIYSKINVPNRIQAIFWVTKNYLHLK
jgi:DNA-binding NarL/FixJ family response regulator